MVQPAARFVSTMLADSDELVTTTRDLHFTDLRKLPEGELLKLAEFMLRRVQGIFIGHSQDMLHIDHQQKVTQHASPNMCQLSWPGHLIFPVMVISSKLHACKSSAS